MKILDLINEIKQKNPQLQELTVNYKGVTLLEYELSEVIPNELRNNVFENIIEFGRVRKFNKFIFLFIA
jgi:hypothetical protein